MSFEEVVRLIDLSGTATGAAYSRSDVVEALHEHQPAVVAVASGALVGAIVARVCGADAHLLMLAIHPDWRQQGIGSALLRELDQEIIHRGARRLLALVVPARSGRSPSPTRASPTWTVSTSTSATHRWCPRSWPSWSASVGMSPGPGCGSR